MIGPKLFDRLTTWQSVLDAQIGDTDTEIEKRRAANISAVQARDDLRALIEYARMNQLPPAVERALERCLSWNPFTSRGRLCPPASSSRGRSSS